MWLNTRFQFLNNITRIFIYFFTHTYFQKINITKTILPNEPLGFFFLYGLGLNNIYTLSEQFG